MAIGNAFLGGFCRTPASASFFGKGWRLRIDALDHGANPRKGVELTACPAWEIVTLKLPVEHGAWTKVILKTDLHSPRHN